jgi:hypothetical protein
LNLATAILAALLGIVSSAAAWTMPAGDRHHDSAPAATASAGPNDTTMPGSPS